MDSTFDQRLAGWILEDAASAFELPDSSERPDYRTGHIDRTNKRAAAHFGESMGLRMVAARKAGRGGWHDPEQCSVADLRRMFDEQCLRAHPDFVDVANFAMMLHYRTRGLPGYDPSIPLPDSSSQ